MEKNKKNKFRNPLDGIPTKSLLITLFALLLTFGIGFGSGYSCNALIGSSSSDKGVTTAYALESRQIATYQISPYPSITISGDYYTSANPYLLRNPAIVPSSSDYDFLPFEMLPEAGSLVSLNSYGSVYNLSRIGFIGLDISCQRTFVDFRNRTSGLPLLKFSRTELIRANDGSWGRASGYSSVYCLFDLLQGADALSQDTFSASYNTSLYFVDGSFVSLPYSLTYLNSSSVTLDNLVAERTVYLLLPLRSTFISVRPDGAVTSSNPVVNNFVFDYRLFTSENENLAENPYVDIRLSFSFNVSQLPLMFPNVTLFSQPAPNVVNYEVNPSLLERYQQGYSDGYLTGFSEGQNAGFSLGYEDGLAKGRSEALADITPWKHIVNGVNSFLNLEILPGVRLSLLIYLSFGLILLGFLLKFFLGG